MPGSPLLLPERLRALAALARRLTRDPHTAADAVQDTVVAALSTTAPPRVASGGWLGAILRNVIRQRARGEARRQRREALAPPMRPAPSTLDVVSELSTHRRLLELVQDLDEPYRATLFLRFWRGLSPRAIAAQQGVPHKTVHTRIERALARLRQRLDREPGGRSAWLAALLPLAHTSFPTPALGGLLLLMKTKLIVGAGALLALLALGSWLWSAGRAVTADRLAAAPVASVGAPAPPPVAPATQAARREVVAAPPATRAEPTRTPAWFTGHVQDLRGAPVAGVAVRFEAGGATAPDASGGAPARSGPDGTFQLPLPDAEGWLTSHSQEWAPVRRPWLTAGQPVEPPVLVVAPQRSYAGTVVDPQGQPVAGARVVVLVAATLVPVQAVGGKVLALPEDLAATDSDAQGRFHLPRVGLVPGARLTAALLPWRPASMELPGASTSSVVLKLGAAQELVPQVHGLVLLAGGAPAAGAEVSVGGNSARTGGDGRFALPWPRKAPPELVHAVLVDRGTASARLVPGADQPGWRQDHPVILRLPEAPVELHGRVVDDTGQPVAGVRVWTPDLTWFGVIERSEQGHEISRDSSVEGIAARGNDPYTVSATSAADGSFVLRGLAAREYAVFAVAPDTLATAGPVLAAPGAAVELHLKSGPLQRVAGRVVTRSGKPLAGLRVAPGRGFAGWQPPSREHDPWAGAPMVRMGVGQVLQRAAVVTDAEGRFQFSGLDPTQVFLVLTGDALMLSERCELNSDQDLAHLELVVTARSTFRISLGRRDEADAFSLSEPDGGHVTLLVRVEGFLMSMGKIDLVDGSSPEAQARAGATVVVLYRRGVEVRRATVVLPEGGVHEVRP